MRLFRVDVVSVEEPDQPFHRAYIEAASIEKAEAAALWIVADHATNPELHYGDLWAEMDGAPGHAEYVCSIELPTPQPPALPDGIRRWAWMTGSRCGDCGHAYGVSRGWVESGEDAEVEEDWCQGQGHRVATWYGPDPDADQVAAAAVERWRERNAYALEAATLLAAGTPHARTAARWYARQVAELTAAMPEEIAYRVRVTLTADRHLNGRAGSHRPLATETVRCATLAAPDDRGGAR
jgi:hypothetical protein